MADNDARSDAWVKDASFDELTRAPKVIAEFRAHLLADSSYKKEAEGASAPLAEHIARAIVLRRLVSDDSSLERLVELGEAASADLQKAVLADHDLRLDPPVVASHRLLERLWPVLAQCGQLLESRRVDPVGKAAHDLVGKARRLLYDYDVLGFKYGAIGVSHLPNRATFRRED